VEAHKYKKVVRRLYILASDPEIAVIGRRIFCAESRVPQQEEATPKNNNERIGRILDFVAIGFALGGWLYTVINPEPNFVFGSVLLFGTMAFFVCALWEYVSWKRRGKIASALCGILLFAGFDFLWHLQRSAIAKKAVQTTQIADSKEVFQSLTARMEYEIGDDPIMGVLAYSNGSSLPILIDGIQAYSNALFLGGGKYDVASFGKNHFILLQNVQRLESGGDGQTDPFLQSIFANGVTITGSGGKRPPISCADLLVWINYRLESQPTLEQKKYFRFVTLPSSKGLRWVKEGLESKTTYCNQRSPTK